MVRNRTLGFGAVFLNLPGRFETAQARHADVHQDNIRPEFAAFVDSIAAVGRFANDFHIILG